MTVPTLDDDEFKRLRTLIQSWCGIALEDSKKYLVESRLRDVVLETGCASYGGSPTGSPTVERRCSASTR